MEVDDMSRACAQGQTQVAVTAASGRSHAGRYGLSTREMAAHWSRERLAWVAGIVEGEGCIGASSRGREWSLRVKMTDRDVVERLLDWAGCGRVTGPMAPAKPGHKPTWQWSVTRWSDVYALLAALHPWLGARRRARAEEAIVALGSMVRLRGISDDRRTAVLKDRADTGDSYAKLAVRHGISSSRVAQMCAVTTLSSSLDR